MRMPHTTSRGLSTLLLPALLIGCATAKPASGGNPSPNHTAATASATTPAPRRDPNRLTGDEIRATMKSDLYDVVSTAHPAWVRSMGQSSAGGSPGVKVYVDGAPVGTVEALHNIDARTVASIVHLSASAATTRFGLGHTDGALLVTLLTH